MRMILLLLAILALGCGSSGITIYTMKNGEPEPVAQIDQKFAGKGCIAVEHDGTKTSIAVDQAGTSDWSLSRLFAFLGDIAGGVFGGSRGSNEMDKPTPMQGCDGLFGGSDDTGDTE